MVRGVARGKCFVVTHAKPWIKSKGSLLAFETLAKWCMYSSGSSMFAPSAGVDFGMIMRSSL